MAQKAGREGLRQDLVDPFGNLTDQATVKKVDSSVVAPVEDGTTASQAYAIGEHFIKNGQYCTAKTAITVGATLTLNTNYVAGDVSEGINFVVKKAYTVTGAGTNDYLYIYRIGKIRIVHGHLPGVASGAQLATLEAVDTPKYNVEIDEVDWTNHAAYGIRFSDNKKVLQLGSSTAATNGVIVSGVYVVDPDVEI